MQVEVKQVDRADIATRLAWASQDMRENYDGDHGDWARLMDSAKSEIEGLRVALAEVEACMMRRADGSVSDCGWNVSRLTKARPKIRAALHKDDSNGS